MIREKNSTIPYWLTYSTEQIDPVLMNISSMSRFKEGWSYGRGEAIGKNVLKTATNIYRIIKNYRGDKELSYNISPSESGGVVFTIGYLNRFVSLFINPNTSIDIDYEIGFGDDFETIKEYENQNFGTTISIICDLLELYTPASSILPKDDLIQTSSAITGEGSVLLVQSVLTVKRTRKSANTSGNIMIPQLVTQ